MTNFTTEEKARIRANMLHFGASESTIEDYLARRVPKARTATAHFNGLTPAEAERLGLLAEECGEVLQVVGKILRHGYASWHPETGEVNRDLLMKELTDLTAAMVLMARSGDTLLSQYDSAAVTEVLKKKSRYMHHQSEDIQRG